MVELLDAEGQVLHREPALVTPEIDCEPGAAQRFRLLAYIGLHPDAAAVQLRHTDLLLWRTEIPPPPEVRVTMPRGRPDRHKPFQLRLRYSEPGDDAHLNVVFQWGERHFQTVYVGPPSEAIAVDLGDVPGGGHCRFVVAYSNGLRSSGDATKVFKLARLGPTLTIDQPREDEVAIAGTPVVLAGNVSDPERSGGARPDEHLAWYIDGERVGLGPITSVDGVGPGTHEMTLEYQGDPGASVSTEIRVRESEVPTASEWPDWDPIDEDTTVSFPPEERRPDTSS